MIWVIVSVVVFTNHLGVSLENYSTQEACWSAIVQRQQQVSPPGMVFYCGVKYSNPLDTRRKCQVGDNTLIDCRLQ